MIGDKLRLGGAGSTRAAGTPNCEWSMMLRRRPVQTPGDLGICVVGLRGLEPRTSSLSGNSSGSAMV
jgi:hypothetical protein